MVYAIVAHKALMRSHEGCTCCNAARRAVKDAEKENEETGRGRGRGKLRLGKADMRIV